MAIPTDVEGTWFNSTVSLDAGEARRADSAMFAGDGTVATGARGGIVRHADTSLAVTVDGSDVVTVQPGAVVVPGNAVAGSGPYRLSLSAAITGSLAARNATNPRITLVIFRALDDDVVGTHDAYKGRIEFVDGTPAASPTAPALPSMAVELGRITVPQTAGGAASVDATSRTFAAAVGAEIIVPTLTKLPTTAAKYQRARALDTGEEYEFNTSWVVRPKVVKVVKPTDQTRTSSTTLTNDTALSFAVISGATYVFNVYVAARSASSSVDISLGFSFPTGTMTFGGIGMDPAISSGNFGNVVALGAQGATSGSTSVSYGVSSSSSTPIFIHGSFVATASGTVSLMFAQATSSGTGVTVQAGSYLRAERAA